jgi:hypothetical protein
MQHGIDISENFFGRVVMVIPTINEITKIWRQVFGLPALSGYQPQRENVVLFLCLR